MSESSELEVFQPNPGSRLAAAQNAEQQSVTAIDYAVPVPVEDTFIVQTREQRGYHRSARTVVIGAGQTRRILNRNDLRRSAIVSCVSGTVVLCASNSTAQSVQAQALTTVPTADIPGFWMASGTPGSAVPTEGMEGMEAVATNSGTAVVSVIEEWWAD
jgi:hypothetical protein